MRGLAVSDTSGNTGWWMASDGAWYPPELHPSVTGPGPGAGTGVGPSTGTGAGAGAGSGPGAVGTVAPPPVQPGNGRPGNHGGYGNYGDPADFSDFVSFANRAAGQGQVSRKRSRRFVMGVVGALVVAVVVVAGLVIVTSGQSSGWTDNSLHVVGSPVVAGGVVLVIDVTSGHQLELSAIDPTSGSVRWSHPYSASEITPGVAFGPTVLGNTVLALSPESGTSDPGVYVRGIDVSTGKVLWSVPQAVVLGDAPAVCAGGESFCLATYVSDTETDLAILDPTTGTVVGAIRGPERNMAVAQPGSVSEGDLWQTSASVPTLLQTSPTGEQAWTKTVASLFGGSQYDPDYGWDFQIEGPLDVGSVGPKTSGSAYPWTSSRPSGSRAPTAP